MHTVVLFFFFVKHPHLYIFILYYVWNHVYLWPYTEALTVVIFNRGFLKDLYMTVLYIISSISSQHSENNPNKASLINQVYKKQSVQKKEKKWVLKLIFKTHITHCIVAIMVSLFICWQTA